jgi:O-antigen ligase
MGNPIGYGIGMGAERLGFTNLAGVLTIDTYYLLIALEYGLLGFVVYYGMLLTGVGKAGLALFNANEPDREALLLAPLAIAIVVFVVEKSVFSQEANHSLIYMMLAAIMALSARLLGKTVSLPAVDSPARAMPARRYS